MAVIGAYAALKGQQFRKSDHSASTGKEKEPKFNKFNRIKVFHEGFQGKRNEGRRDRGKACRK